MRGAVAFEGRPWPLALKIRVPSSPLTASRNSASMGAACADASEQAQPQQYGALEVQVSRAERDGWYALPLRIMENPEHLLDIICR